jgi:hypothetical protein
MSPSLKRKVIIEFSFLFRWGLGLFLLASLAQSYIHPLFLEAKELENSGRHLQAKINNAPTTLKQKELWETAHLQIAHIKDQIQKEKAPQDFDIEKLKSILTQFKVTVHSANLEQNTQHREVKLELEASYPDFLQWLEHLRMEAPWVYVSQFKINRKKTAKRRRSRRSSKSPKNNKQVAIHSLEVKWTY